MATKRGKTKMKKLLILAAAVVMGVMNAQAKDLYAHVGVTFDTETVKNYEDYTTVYILFSEKFATWDNDKTYDTLKDYSIGSYTEGYDNEGEGYMQYYYDNPSGFYLMPYNEEDTRGFVALVTDGKSFATLHDYTLVPKKDSEILTFENEDNPVASTMPFAGAVPEPTSGLLLLLGVAGLALKRKRA